MQRDKKPKHIRVGTYAPKGHDTNNQFLLWYSKLDHRRSGTDEKTFSEVMAAILATRSWDGGFCCDPKAVTKEQYACFKAVVSALMGEVIQRFYGKNVYRLKPHIPRLVIVSTSTPDLMFSVTDKSHTVTWQNAQDIDPDLVGLVARVRPLVVDLPLLDLEFAYQWSSQHVPRDAHNKGIIPKHGLPIRYRALDALPDDLIALGRIACREFVEAFDRWCRKRGFISVVAKTGSGASVFLPETFSPTFVDWFADQSMYVFRQMGIPQFIPVAHSRTAPNENLFGVGKNLSRERQLAATG